MRNCENLQRHAEIVSVHLKFETDKWKDLFKVFVINNNFNSLRNRYIISYNKLHY